MKIVIDVCDKCKRQPKQDILTGSPDFLYAMSCKHEYICDECLYNKNNPFQGRCPLCGGLSNFEKVNEEMKQERNLEGK